MKKISKKITSFCLGVFLVLTLIAPVKVSAASLTPNLNHAGYNSASPFIQTSASLRGQCTWFAWGRTYEKLGIKLNSNFWGHAKTWYTKNASAKCYPYGQEPRANSLAIFKNGSYGHVVFVEKVENGIIYFNEANHHKSKAYDGALESQSISNFKNRAGAGNFSGFIYVGGTSSTTTGVSGCNAKIVGDWAYVRDANGNIIQGRRVDVGDNIKVKEINYDKQLALVEYPVSGGTYTGWIKNCSIIQYYYQGQYKNGSTKETVYDASGKVIGYLDPYESATPLFRDSKTNRLYVVYNTTKGTNTKGGYVVYNGGFNKF